MAGLKLRFNEGTPCELQRSEFTFKDNRAVVATRGQSFSWTKGVKALCLLLVDYKLWCVRGGDPAGFEFQGRQGSPAASLDAAVGKWSGNDWLKRVFDNDTRTLTPQQLFRRTNPDGKRKSAPYGVGVVPLTLVPAQLEIVCGARPQQSAEELADLLGRLQSQWSGKANELVTPVIPVPAPFESRSNLLRELAERAAQWERQGLPAHRLSGFRMIGEDSPLLRKDHEQPRDVLLFSLAEFARTQPATRAITALVLECLQKHQCCHLSSAGATGKTTLAVQLALDGKASLGVAFHLSLRGQDGRQDALTNALVELSRWPVLIILDDVHLAPQLAEWLFSVWRSSSRQARLLLLARQIVSGVGHAYRDRLQVREQESLRLELTEAEMTAIFQTQLQRLQRPLPDRVQIPNAVARRWKRLFGADLMCFTQAIATRSEVLQEGDFELWATDAGALVRQRFGEDFDEAERRELLRLALFSAFGIQLPEFAVDVGRLNRAIAGGWVHHARLEASAMVGICDPGLAELLIECAVPEVNKAKLFVEVADRFPYFAMGAIMQMECTADEPAETQPFAGSWTVGELLCSGEMHRWVERYRLNELAGMIHKLPERGFQHAVVLRELAKVPNPWPNYPYRSLGKPDLAVGSTSKRNSNRPRRAGSDKTK